MSQMRKLISRLVLFVLIGVPSCYGAISVRAGAAFPQGEFKQLAKAGWTLDLMANLRTFPVDFITVAVVFSSTGFGTKEADYRLEGNSLRQSSKISVTGGGAGLRLEPPSPIFKPFAEVLGRIASVQQEYKSGAGGSDLETKTKFGYQINGGLKYAFLPKVNLEVGASYLSLFKTKFNNEQRQMGTDVKVWSVFAGLSLGLGF